MSKTHQPSPDDRSSALATESMNTRYLNVCPRSKRNHVDHNHSTNDVYIAVMGVTGAGKSKFISDCSGLPVQIGTTLKSCKGSNKTVLQQASLTFGQVPQKLMITRLSTGARQYT